MITLFTALFILISVGLVLTVPVALGTPREWESSKANVIKSFEAWVALVVLIAILDGVGYQVENYS